MKCALLAATLMSLMWSAVASAPAAAQGAAPGGAIPADIPQNPRITASYVVPQNPAFRPIHDKLKNRQVLERLRAFLSPLQLPKTIDVKLDQCNRPATHYRPGSGSVVICYEYIADLERLAPDIRLTIGGRAFTKDDALTGAFVHLVLHEMARATFDVLEIPVWGREEFAADRVAGFLMLQFGDNVAYRTLVGTSWFLAQASVVISGLPTGDFSYVRGVDGATLQRFYNVLCVALGGDPAKFDFLKKTLPKNRAEHCRYEYLQLTRSFEDTYMPYVNKELMAKVRTIDWLAP